MVRYGGSSAGSYLADPTSPIPSHCAVTILFKKCSSASIVVPSTVRVNIRHSLLHYIILHTSCQGNTREIICHNIKMYEQYYHSSCSRLHCTNFF